LKAALAVVQAAPAAYDGASVAGTGGEGGTPKPPITQAPLLRHQGAVCSQCHKTRRSPGAVERGAVPVRVRAEPQDAHLVDGFVAGILQPQVNHGVLQRPPHVELQGEVVNPLEEKTNAWSLSPGPEDAQLDPRSCGQVSS